MMLLLGACAPVRPADPATDPAADEAIELPEHVASALIQGGARAQAGDLDGALGFYRYAHEQLPGDVHIALRYADTALQKGHPREALRALNSAAREGPADLELETRRIRIHMALGDLQKASELAAVAAEEFPDSPEILELNALSLEHGEMPTDAIAAYEALLELRPGDRELQARLGELLLKAGRAKEARVNVEGALRVDADDHELLELHKRILDELDASDEAMPFLQELIELHPRAVPPRTQMADRHLGRGEAEEAVAVLMPVAEGGELSWGPRMLLADLLLRLHRVEESQELVDELLKEGHEAALLFRLAGELAQRSEDLESAERWLRRAVKADENDLEAYVALLLVLSQRQPEIFDPTVEPTEQTHQFNRLLTQANELASAGHLRYDYLLGTLLRRTGRFGEAIVRLEHAMAEDPENEDILYGAAADRGALSQFLRLSVGGAGLGTGAGRDDDPRGAR
jgi:tetratricopeptide (TPR) repeat protein